MKKKKVKSKNTPIPTRIEAVGAGEIGREILEHLRMIVLKEVSILRIRIFREFRSSAISATVILCLTFAATSAFFIAAIFGISTAFNLHYWTSAFIVGTISLIFAVLLNFFAFQIPVSVRRTAIVRSNETLKRR